MKTYIILLLCTLFAVATMAKDYHIIPQPKEILDKEGSFTLKPGTKVYAKGAENIKVAEFFIKKLNASTGLNLSLTAKQQEAQIALLNSKKIKGKEAYSLTVSPQGVKAEASTAQGLFYAMQTFLQLLPPQVEGTSTATQIEWTAPAVVVNDEPRFEYRSFMLDPCRHFFTVDEIKKQIDIMSMYKANNMHLHLTEDQAWRVEIKKYPRLTEVGAPAISSKSALDGTPEPTQYFYTQEQLKDIVAYAQERYINIIPEFEMPGHELAAICAYPWLSCRDAQVKPRALWGIESIVMCPGKETTFQFLQDVIDELVQIFPSKYFHIGGDESPRDEWKKCPLCQKRADELGLVAEKDRSREAQLQSYVVTRMEKYLNKYGKCIIGWDEILEGGGLNKSAVVMSWRGVQGGVQAAKMGHKAVMSPSSAGYYLDYCENDKELEPAAPAYAGPVRLSQTYNYEPISKDLEGLEEYILGPQGNLWAEYMPTVRELELRAYPRILAIMETGWTQRNLKNYTDFCRRLDEDTYLRLQAHGANFGLPAPEQPGGSCNFIAFTDKATLTFETPRPEKMYYTLDGSEPTTQSTLYTGPITVSNSGIVKITTILPCGIKSQTRTVICEKQLPRPALAKPETLTQGLNLQVARGLYANRQELANVETWETTSVNKLEEITSRPGGFGYSAIAEGLLEVPQDGVWFFRANYPEVWIDGIKVVDNTDKLVLIGNRGGRSIALSKGLHNIKVVFVGRFADGTTTTWGGGSILWKHESEKAFQKIKPEQVFKN